MFKKTGDSRYLDKVVRAGYQALEMRDTGRRLPDYLGRIQPVWSAGNPYTACYRDVNDLHGRPMIRLRSLIDGDVVADVRPGIIDASFDVSIESKMHGISQKFTELSLDPGAPRYAVSLLNAASPTLGEVTAVDLRAAGSIDTAVLAERGSMIRYRYAFGVHTGMIAAPLADFAATVRADGALLRQFYGPAADFLEAAQAAVDVHNPEWTSYGLRAGAYRYMHGAPVRGDGTPLPHNQYLAMARTHLLLHQATGDPLHKIRATIMLAVFLSDVGPGPAPVWFYHWSRSPSFLGYSASDNLSSYSPSMAPQTNLEDTAHGALDIECLVLAQSLGLGPPDAFMARLAASFMNRIATESPSGTLTSKNSFGSLAGSSAHDLSVPRWVGLATWDKAVFQFANLLLNQMSPTDISPQLLVSIATLVAHQ